MSWNAGQPPSPVSESTAIEIKRQEGTVRSYVALGTLTAGNLIKLTNSGCIQTVGGEDEVAVLGAAFFTASSGSRVVVGRGQLRSQWDGVGTPKPGDEVTPSTTQSGWWTAATVGSGAVNIGIYSPLPGGLTLGAANSGTLQAIMIY